VIYKLSSKKDVSSDVLRAAALIAARELMTSLHGDECKCGDHESLAEMLADDFMDESLYIDDGRFGFADPISKAAEEARKHSDPLNPKDTAITLTRLVHHLMQRSKIQNRPKFVQSIREHLSELNPYMLSKKKNNPSAAIGAALNIIRNVLQSQPPTVISSILGSLYKML
jgi:hypothetical protein